VLKLKELRLTQKEVILLPVEDILMHKAIMNAKFKEQGFDLTKSIEKYIDVKTGDIVYSQN
jgi:hypothetical protein